MRPKQQYLCFLAAWSVVSLLNATLNACAGDLPSLPYRGFALGALLLLASATHCLERDAAGRYGRIESHAGIERHVYAALFAAIALPSVSWRCFSPLDVSGLASLRHGATITFIFGLVTLSAVRASRSAAGWTPTHPMLKA